MRDRVWRGRDLVVIGSRVTWENIEHHLHRGEPSRLKDSLDGVLEEIQKDQFRDSFHGPFQQYELDESNVDELLDYLQKLRERI